MHQDIKKYLIVSGSGALRALAGLPLEHPFDTVKTVCQAEQKPTWQVTKEIWKKHGLRGYYSGFVPNGGRAALKQSYRYPLMIALPPFFQKIMPEGLRTDYPTSIPTATGLTIAVCETAIICPFERVKVYMQTNSIKKHPLSQFFQQHHHKIFPEITRGLNAVFTKQMVSWISFLIADKKFKDREKKQLQVEILPFPSLMKVALQVGAVNTVANMPFDAVKTNLQKKNYVENQGLIETMRLIYTQNGVKGLYAGWQMRICQYMLQSFFTVSLLDYLERTWKQ